jgi:uncharacterized membrane protein
MTYALKLIALHLVTLVTFVALDAVWLGAIARNLYRRELGHLLAPEVRWGAAGVFYLLYIAGLLVLVVLPAQSFTLARAAALGAVFGLCTYATYDLTNLATLTRWPIGVTLADLAWGSFVTAVAAMAGWKYARWLFT